jgi:hypothetical protein
VLIEYVDYNGADVLLGEAYAPDWHDLSQVIAGMPLHLKASDQAGLEGNAIFDPVGTNAHLKRELVKRGWTAGHVIPEGFAFLGTDVDFVKGGLLGEAQFSNYPFLLNNVIRSELFYKSKTLFSGMPFEVVVIITKGKMFPASNSTLYYEQARSQLNELAKHRVFDAPIRLVGLLETPGSVVEAAWTTYHATRYSRTVTETKLVRVQLCKPRTERSRCAIVIQP